MKPAAAVYLQSGLRLYEEKDYAGALGEFNKGWAIDPHPDFLYAMGQAERLAGNCEKAIAHYGAYLLQVSSPTQAAAAKLQMERCEETLKVAAAAKAEKHEDAGDAPLARADVPGPAPEVEKREAPTEPKPALATPEPAAPFAVAGTEPRPAEAHAWYKDPAGGILAGLALAALVSGFVLFAEANAKVSHAPDSYASYQAALDAPGWQTTGLVVIGVGAGLAVAAALRYALQSSGAPAAADSGASQ
jgi:hypothetical protein